MTGASDGRNGQPRGGPTSILEALQAAYDNETIGIIQRDIVNHALHAFQVEVFSLDVLYAIDPPAELELSLTLTLNCYVYKV